MFDIKRVMRPELLSAQEYNYLRVENNLFLDCNESPWDSDVNRYPQPPSKELMSALSEYYNVDTSQLLLTRGSDEGIDILLRLLCKPYQDNIIISSPTFRMYAVCAQLQGAEVIDVPLLADQDFKLNSKGILDSVTANTKVIFLCSPNNPTGSLISIDEMSKICSAVEDQTVVVVDEAYIEFANQKSMTTLLNKHANLVVLRTLSKALSMAGLRMGFVISSPSIINVLKPLLPPYLFPSLVLDYAKSAVVIDKFLYMREKIDYILREREALKQQLIKVPMITKIWDSQANFIFMQAKNSNIVFEYCVKNKILIRNFPQHSTSPLNNCLRISIGLSEQNQKFLKILQQLSDSNEAAKNTFY